MPIPTTEQRRAADGAGAVPEEEDDIVAGGNRSDGRGRGGGRFERVTVNLAPLSSAALDHAAGITGDSKTDTINRALQIYAMLADAVNDGGQVLIRYADGDVERQRLFPERYDRAPARR
jgi:hypothetical protein